MKKLFYVLISLPFLGWSIFTLAQDDTASLPMNQPPVVTTPTGTPTSTPIKDENNILFYQKKPLQNLLDKLPSETAESIVIRFKVKGLVDQIPGFNGLTNTQIGQLMISSITQSDEAAVQTDNTAHKNSAKSDDKPDHPDTCIKDLFPNPLNNQAVSIDFWQPFTVCIEAPPVKVDDASQNKSLLPTPTSPETSLSN